MKVKFTVHAQSRIEERNIPASRVVETLHKPNSTRPAYEGKIRARKKFGKKYSKLSTLRRGLKTEKKNTL